VSAALRALRGLRRGPFTALVVVLLAIVPTVAYASFPGTNPDESVRANTPNDPDFDQCEPDDAQGQTCSHPFDEQYERFGFAPNSTQGTATYHNPTDPHVQRLVAQNTLAGRTASLGLGQVPGVSADRAWKRSTGDPSVQVAILDTGIRWDRTSLRRQVALNRGELPRPQLSNGSTCSVYDCNDDGAFNVDDYANDPRVSPSSGVHNEADSILDASDLLAVFSDGTDADSNGYVDDIAGWDFFDDDNDPYDASSYSSAHNHGSDRAEEAVEQGNNAEDGIGVCPNCQMVPMRVWDTFVVDTNNFAMAALYAADNNIEIVEGASGGVFNSSFARAAFEYAYRHGVFFTIVSSDLNTADINIPTLYDESMEVAGTVADAHGLGDNCVPEVGTPCLPQQAIDFFNNLGVPAGTNVPIGTWFRNAGTTQYGGHMHIVMPGPTGSQATGQAAGAAGLIKSYARQRGIELAPNEIKQIITGTAQDVVAENTLGTGTPDPASVGWDQHFGYGLPDLGYALEKIGQNKIPPQALIKSPAWFTPYNVNKTSTVDISGRLSARTSTYHWTLEWAPGIEPAESPVSEFHTVASGTESGPKDGVLGTINLATVRAALDTRVTPCPSGPPATGGSTCDPTAPSKGPGDKDPNEPAFTVRVVVTDDDGNVLTTDNRSEDRKMLFAYRDGTETYSKDIGTGGESSQRLFDLNGDNKLDTILGNSSGELSVTDENGNNVPWFNNGNPVRTQPYANVHPGAPSFSSVDPPREVLRTPAIGDIDGDLEPEIVDAAGEHVYAWNADGSVVPGFPVRLDPALSAVPLRTNSNHIKRGFTGSPVLGDLIAEPSGQPRKLEIVETALDQHVYAWDGSGNTLSGFPKKLREPGSTLDGAEIINTPALGDIDGDGKPEIVVSTNEVESNSPGFPPTCVGLGCLLTNFLSQEIGGTGRTYALNEDGSFVPGWPVKPEAILPDVLPLVGPGVDQILADTDGDGQLEAVGNVSTGEVMSRNGNGSTATSYESNPQGGDTVDKGKVLNLFENPIAANLDGTSGLDIIKGGLTLNQAANLLLVGQNFPYNHVVQAWNAQTGASLPNFPDAVDDYQLLSSPSVADVSDAPGNEILVGTGLYYLHDINSEGVEGSPTDCATPPCWPKFTGGWIFPTPAVGDTNGDGNLDITTLTREGHTFSWSTNRPACGNSEWWTSRHDEWSTGAYGTDTRPPGTPTNLHFTNLSPYVVTLGWTVPGDDWLCGNPTKYRVIGSNQPINHPTDGDVLVPDLPTAPGDASDHPNGDTQNEFIPKGYLSYTHFAVQYQDDAGNWGALAKIEVTADLALTQTDAPDPVTVGAPLTYTLNVTNNGPGGSSPTLIDRLPKNVRFRSARSNHGSCRLRSPRRVACTLGTFANGESASVTIVVRPTRPGSITNSATVTGSWMPDLNLSNNSASTTTQVQP
jgi:uncharacterized repeat protein (TIGR01451 family)